jgi:hypothetical protein
MLTIEDCIGISRLTEGARRELVYLRKEGVRILLRHEKFRGIQPLAQ